VFVGEKLFFLSVILEVLYCCLSHQVNNVSHPSDISISISSCMKLLQDVQTHIDVRWQFIVIFIRYYIIWFQHYRKISMQEWVWSSHTL